MYLENVKYILEHRKNIRKSCDYWYEEWLDMYPCSYDKGAKKTLKKILNRIKLKHDLSKFSIKEFRPYAENFFGEKRCNKCKHFSKCDDIKDTMIEYEERALNCKKYRYWKFSEAVEHHYRHNKHHWKYWCYDWWKRDLFPDHDLEYSELPIPIEMPNMYLIEMICDWTAMCYTKGGTPQKYYLENYKKIQLNRHSRYELEIKLGLLFYCAPICQGNEEYWMTIQELKKEGCDLNSILQPVAEKYNINFDDYDI